MTRPFTASTKHPPWSASCGHSTAPLRQIPFTMISSGVLPSPLATSSNNWAISCGQRPSTWQKPSVEDSPDTSTASKKAPLALGVRHWPSGRCRLHCAGTNRHTSPLARCSASSPRKAVMCRPRHLNDSSIKVAFAPVGLPCHERSTTHWVKCCVTLMWRNSCSFRGPGANRSGSRNTAATLLVCPVGRRGRNGTISGRARLTTLH